MTKNVGLCHRCDHRATFLERGFSLRYECSQVNKAISSCYAYRPVTPLLLKKDSGDKCPQFAGAMISSRSHSEGLSDCRLNLEQSKKGSTLYWTPKSLDGLHIKARDMLWFLDCHPALGSPFFDVMSLLHIDISQVCKNGFIEPMKGKMPLRYTPERYKQYKDEFDKEFKEYTPDELKLQKGLVSIDVPYEKIYGEKWAPDHIEYWGDLTFMVYTGKNFKKEHDLTKWQRLSGIEASGRSFEDLIVNIGTKFKKTFGDFNHDKILTPHERKNNKGKMPFRFEKIKGNERCSRMLTNKAYIRVGPGEENRRWLKWFAKTTYCKKNWAETVQAILAGKEKIF